MSRFARQSEPESVYNLIPQEPEKTKPKPMHRSKYPHGMGADGMEWNGMDVEGCGWNGMGWDGMGWGGKEGKKGKRGNTEQPSVCVLVGCVCVCVCVCVVWCAVTAFYSIPHSYSPSFSVSVLRSPFSVLRVPFVCLLLCDVVVVCVLFVCC